MEQPTLFQRFWNKLVNINHVSYSGLTEELDDDKIQGQFDDSVSKETDASPLTQAFYPNIWLFTTVILLIITIRGQPRYDGYKGDANSIWTFNNPDIAESLYGTEKRRFTSAIRDDVNGNLYTVSHQDEPTYVGLPTREIDENWDQLIAGRYFRLEDSEVLHLNQDPKVEDLTEMPQNERIAEAGFYGGPDVLHSLHCLNAMRKHIDMQYYEASMTLPKEYRRMHLDHCIDHLRQALLCHGDLTPVTMKPVVANTSLPYPVVFYLGQTELEHTCRNTEAIRSWVKARGEHNLAIGMDV